MARVGVSDDLDKNYDFMMPNRVIMQRSAFPNAIYREPDFSRKKFENILFPVLSQSRKWNKFILFKYLNPSQPHSSRFGSRVMCLFNSCQPDQEFAHMNFQNNQNSRLVHANFFNPQTYEAGNNILLNRLSHLNNKIEKAWLNLNIDSFKIKCKNFFCSLNKIW